MTEIVPDVAIVLALDLLAPDVDLRDPESQRQALEANPLLGEVRSIELEVYGELIQMRARLAELRLLLADQTVELLDRHTSDRDEPVRDIAQRMSDVDQRRMTASEYGASMASPLRLGPPDSLLLHLADLLEVEQ